MGRPMFPAHGPVASGRYPRLRVSWSVKHGRNSNAAICGALGGPDAGVGAGTGTGTDADGDCH